MRRCVPGKRKEDVTGRKSLMRDGGEKERERGKTQASTECKRKRPRENNRAVSQKKKDAS
jgi:hypothetical protein